MAMAILHRFVIISITIISAAILAASGKIDYCTKKCPCENPMTYTVHLPGPTKAQFYVCNFGIGILMNCAPGTHFDPLLQVCNWPSAAKAVTCSKPPNCSDEGSGDSGEEYD